MSTESQHPETLVEAIRYFAVPGGVLTMVRMSRIMSLLARQAAVS